MATPDTVRRCGLPWVSGRIGAKVFHRTLEPASWRRLLETPQWIFDHGLQLPDRGATGLTSAQGNGTRDAMSRPVTSQLEPGHAILGFPAVSASQRPQLHNGRDPQAVYESAMEPWETGGRARTQALAPPKRNQGRRRRNACPPVQEAFSTPLDWVVLGRAPDSSVWGLGH